MWFSKSYLSSVGIIFKAGLINHLYPACLKALNSVSGEDLKPEHYRQDGCGGFLKEWRTDLSFLLCNLKYIDPLCWKVLAQGPAGESYTVLKLQLSCPLQAVSCLKKMRVLSCFIVRVLVAWLLSCTCSQLSEKGTVMSLTEDQTQVGLKQKQPSVQIKCLDHCNENTWPLSAVRWQGCSWKYSCPSLRGYV